MCVPTPATAGSKVPMIGSIIPGPLNVPPIGLAIKSLAAASIQNGPPLILTTGNGLTTKSVDILVVQPFASVYS